MFTKTEFGIFCHLFQTIKISMCTIEYKVLKIGKMTANLYMMRYYISLHGFIDYADEWLDSLILSRITLCNVILHSLD